MFRAIGTSTGNLVSFLERVADEHPSPSLRAEAKEMLLRQGTAFFPEDTDESLEMYMDLLGEKVCGQLDLYRELKKRGAYCGGEKPFQWNEFLGKIIP